MNGDRDIRVVVGYLLHEAWNSITLASIVVNGSVTNQKLNASIGGGKKLATSGLKAMAMTMNYKMARVIINLTTVPSSLHSVSLDGFSYAATVSSCS